MKIENLPLRAEFRSCEWNQPWHSFCFGRVDPHHIWAKGMGGGGTLDVRINLIGLCRRHHDLVHSGHISRDELLDIVAERERTTKLEIVAEIHRLRLLPKGAVP